MKKLVIFALLVLPGLLFAGEEPVGSFCGEGTDKPVCECGDTVMGNFTFTGDMYCPAVPESGSLSIGADGIVIDGNGYTLSSDALPDTGLITEGVGINNVDGGFNFTLRNLHLKNVSSGVRILGATGGLIEGNTFEIGNNAVELNGASGVVFRNNTVSRMANSGVFLSNGSTGNTFSGNTFSKIGFVPVQIISGAGNTYTNNTIEDSFFDFSADSTGTYSGNISAHLASSTMIRFTELDRVKAPGETFYFTFSIYDFTGDPCGTACNATLTLSPSESSFVWEKDGSDISGSFVPSRAGFYTLQVSISDNADNRVERNFSFLSGTVGSKDVRYYLRNLTPTHGQAEIGTGRDSRSLLFSLPEDSEDWTCGQWVQNSIDQLPDFPLANLTSSSIYSSYAAKSTLTDPPLGIGLSRFGQYFYNVDVSSPISESVYPAFIEVNKEFSDLDWMMDYPKSWYWVAAKLTGGNPVHWRTSPADPTYADFTYQYSVTPAIKTISNTEVRVLSATQSSASTQDAVIELENPESAATTTTLTLTGFDRPFQNASSVIDSTGTTTVTATVSANSTKTLAAVPLDITPNSGSITVSVNTWETNGEYRKSWTEDGEGVSAATHEVGNLAPDSLYKVLVDGRSFGNYTSDSSGQITFEYQSGYSTHTFAVEPTEAPSSGSTVARRVARQVANSATTTSTTTVAQPIDRQALIQQLQAQIQVLLAQLRALLEARGVR